MKNRRLIPEGYLDEVFAAHPLRPETDEDGGLGAASVAGRTETTEARTPPPSVRRARARRRPRAAERKWGETDVVLSGRQIDFLDSVVRRLRKRGDQLADRQSVLRAMLDGVDEASVDFSRAASVQAMKQTIRSQLATPSLLRLPQTAIDSWLKILTPLAENMLDLLRTRPTPKQRPRARQGRTTRRGRAELDP